MSVWSSAALVGALAASNLVTGWWLVWLGFPAVAGAAGLMGRWSE
jgi:hypothetical protein